MGEGSEKAEAQVIVVGAGAAGLAAARELCAAGLKVLVLEARERIGGRVYTFEDAGSPVPVELGAEFIHGGRRELWDVVARARLLACDASERHWYVRGGRLEAGSGEFWSELEEVFARMKEEPRDRPVAEFLAEHCRDEQTRRVATLYVEGFHAARAGRVGTRGLVRTEEAADLAGDVQARLPGGYARVVEDLHEGVGEQRGVVRLGVVVREVRWGPRRVEVRGLDAGGKEVVYRAECAVLTMPLGVLQAEDGAPGAVRFEPEPRGKRAAARGLEMGHAFRVTLRFRDRFWEALELPTQGGRRESLARLGFLHSPDAALPTWWSLYPLRAPVLVGWAGGAQAEEFLDAGKDDRVARAVGSLAGVLGVPRAHVEERLAAAHAHDWSADPFARGAYSYLPVGGLEAQAELARPVEATLFYAGEATDTEGHHGTVHGAIATGLRAAREVVESFGGG